MSNQISIIEQAMLKGNLAALQPQQKVEYYAKVCESLGLNPLTKPFEYITLNGKEVLYATKACTEQLRTLKKVSLKIVDKQNIEGVYIVTAEAKDADGREDSATGAVSIQGLKGDALANAFMKAETKAKRRVTLSICGLGILDESELETIPESAKKIASVTEIKPVAQIKPKHEVVADIQAQQAFDDASQNDFETFVPPQSELQNGFVDNVITFGKFKGKKFSEVGFDDLNKYCQWMEKKAQEDDKEIPANIIDFMQNVYLMKK
jgi:hypothetical protein